MHMQRLARTCVVLVSAGFATTPETAGQAAAQPAQGSQANPMKIRIVVEGTTVAGTLENTPTAREFASLLPLSLRLTDYARTEKVADLPRRLSTQGAPAGYEPTIGDITYYAPWGNLALFYKDFSYSTGLIKLGTIEAAAATLSRSGAMQATIELVMDQDSRSLVPHPR